MIFSSNEKILFQDELRGLGNVLNFPAGWLLGCIYELVCKGSRTIQSTKVKIVHFSHKIKT